MKLSVIIPYYNCNRLIGRMLDSLLDQDLAPDDYEIIVVDDGSDEEPAVVKDYVARFPQIHYYRIAHAGLSPARNYALTVARGEWLYFCDGDDAVQPRVFGGIISAAEERQLDIVFARVDFPSNTYHPFPRRNFSELTEPLTLKEYFGSSRPYFIWGVWSYLIRRSVLESSRVSFTSIFYVEDRLFLLDLVPYVKRVAHIDVLLYYYYPNEISILHSRKKNDVSGYTDAMVEYLRRMTEFYGDSSASPELSDTIRWHIDLDSLKVLTASFRYGTVKETKDAISKLSAIGAYPLEESGQRFRLLTQKLMNRRGIWLFLCRLFHLLPRRLRLRT